MSVCPQCGRVSPDPVGEVCGPCPRCGYGTCCDGEQAEHAEPVIRVVGRGGPFRASARGDGGEVTIRVDSDRDDAFWLEVTLTRVQLAGLLASIEEAT